MNRTTHWVGLSLTVSALAVLAERDAAACGGCFHPPTQTATDITDERMLLSVSATQSTLYDQIEYSGIPTSFAWVLPIHGTVTSGLSADVLFDSIDALTATQINRPPQNCPAPPNCGAAARLGRRPVSAAAGGGARPPTVMVLEAGERGPVRDGAAALERLERARHVAHAERLQHPRRRRARSSTSTSRRASTSSR